MGRYTAGASVILTAIGVFVLTQTYASSIIDLLALPEFLQIAVKYYLLMFAMILMAGGWWLLLYSYLYKSQGLTRG